MSARDNHEQVYLDGEAVPFSFGQLLDVLAHYIGDTSVFDWAATSEQVEWLHMRKPFVRGQWHFAAVQREGVIRIKAGA